MGTFGGFTVWAVVFLIIFVLLLLLREEREDICVTTPGPYVG
ncbi:MAG: hypothetical protein JWN30_972 [Bacilli bacterium]|nr:hypothetical protein [Bacilli bacterium]